MAKASVSAKTGFYPEIHDDLNPYPSQKTNYFCLNLLKTSHNIQSIRDFYAQDGQILKKARLFVFTLKSLSL